MDTPITREALCPWFRGSTDRQPECGLLRELTGVREEGYCTLKSDACAACMQWYTPTVEDLNPVVASLLYTLSTEIVRSGGRAGCSGERAGQLREMALNAIPHDYDCVPVAEQVDSQPNTRIADISSLVPRPRKRHGPRVRQWAVAVTTAPRKQPTLDRSLRSILAAGWTDPRIVVDGDVPIASTWRHLPSTRREPGIGAWPSYFLALTELLMRSPEADAYMIVQDDVVFFAHSSLRSYLESILWPDRRAGIVSLYCSRAYATADRGWHRLDQNLVWGGQALIFSKQAAIHFLSDPEIVRHRFTRSGLANIDGLIGRWAAETGTPVHVSSPSLSQHIGHISSLWRGTKAFAFRSAAEFAGNCDQ